MSRTTKFSKHKEKNGDTITTHYGNTRYYRDGEKLGRVEDLRGDVWLKLLREGKLDPMSNILD